MSLELYYPGLEGVCVGETNISTTELGGLYRGYPVADLLKSSSFLEVAFLLITGELPTLEEYADFSCILADEAELPAGIEKILQDLPMHVPMIDVIRTGVSLLSHYDPQHADDDAESSFAKAIRILARVPLMISARHRHQQGWNALHFLPELSYPRNLILHLTNSEPTILQEQSLERILVLQAGCVFESAEFSARLVASTESDIYSALVGAISAAQGLQSVSLCQQIGSVLERMKSVDDATDWVRWSFEKRGFVPGFKKATHSDSQPAGKLQSDKLQTNKRQSKTVSAVSLLQSTIQELKCESGKTQLTEITEAMEAAAYQYAQLVPTTDWFSILVYSHLGFSSDLFATLSLVGRIACWSAHVIEQKEEARPFAPHTRYRGALNREIVPFPHRG